jgi:hypothetical protein
LIAFDDPTQLDFRAGTTLCHVTASGRIDTERYQQLPGLSTTVAELLRYFGVPATSSSPSPTRPAWPGLPGLALVVAVGLAVGERTSRRIRHPGTRPRSA